MTDKPYSVNGFHGRFFLAWTLWEGRHQRRLTQAALGEMVGELRGEPVAQSTVNDWLNRVVPSVEDTGYLADALEVSRCWLAYEEGKGPENPVLTGSRPVPRKRS